MVDKKKKDDKKEKNDQKAPKGRSLTGKPLDKIDTTPTLHAVSNQLSLEDVGSTVVLTFEKLDKEQITETLTNGIDGEVDNVLVVVPESITTTVSMYLVDLLETTFQFDNLAVIGSVWLSEGHTARIEHLGDATLSEAVLSIQQRLKRKNIMKRLKAKIKRGRRIAQKKFASPKKLQLRAARKARQLVRIKLAGKQGKEYKNLSLASRISIDKRVSKKQALIKKLAKRLLPKVRKAETVRLAQARKGSTNEAVLDKAQKERLMTKQKRERETLKTRQERERDSAMIRKIRREDEDLITIIDKMLDNINEMELSENVLTNLEKKSSQHNVRLDTLKVVYLRGVESFNEEKTKLTKEQYAFNRVNSFLSGGAAAKQDSDLVEDSMIAMIMPQMVKKLGSIRYKKQYQQAIQRYLEVVKKDPSKRAKGNTLGAIAREYQNVSARQLYNLLKKYHPQVLQLQQNEEMTYEEYMVATGVMKETVNEAVKSLAKKKASDIMEKMRSQNKGIEMKNFKQFNEARSGYDIYHKDFSSAVQHAMKQAKDRGFEIDDDEWFSKVSSGPKKPGSGKTNSYNIDLMKKGMPAKQRLHMQVYNKGGDIKPYELNMYIQ